MAGVPEAHICPGTWVGDTKGSSLGEEQARRVIRNDLLACIWTTGLFTSSSVTVWLVYNLPCLLPLPATLSLAHLCLSLSLCSSLFLSLSPSLVSFPLSEDKAVNGVFCIPEQELG